MKLLVILLFVSIATLSGAETPLWKGATTGMTKDQVVGMFPTAVKPEKPTELLGEIFEGLRIANYDYLDVKFEVRFYFVDGALHQVALSPKGVNGYKELMALAKKATKDLESNLGEPTVQKTKKEVAGYQYESSWIKDDRTVGVYVLFSGVAEELYSLIAFNINYQEPQNVPNQSP